MLQMWKKGHYARKCKQKMKMSRCIQMLMQRKRKGKYVSPGRNSGNEWKLAVVRHPTYGKSVCQPDISNKRALC